MQLSSIVLAYNCESWVQSIKAKQRNKQKDTKHTCVWDVGMCVYSCACLHITHESQMLAGQMCLSEARARCLYWLTSQSSLGSASLQSNFKLMLEPKLKSSELLSKHFIHGVICLANILYFQTDNSEPVNL